MHTIVSRSRYVTGTMLYLALILMLMIGASEGTCPDMCECKEYPRDDLPETSFYYTSVSCEAYQESTVGYLDNTTRQFRLSNVDESGVLSALERLMDRQPTLPFLDDLTISKSELSYENTSALDLDWIRSLTLTDNKLSVLPQLFSNLSALQTLDLSRNILVRIGDHPFRALGTLESLNLSANAINNISNSGFLGLNKLKRLDLSRNNLTSLSDGTFTLQSLQHLNLSSNRLEVLEQCFSRLTALQQLDVSWNQLSRVAPGSLELPSLTRLLLAGNEHLGTSPDAAVLVGTGRKLQIVDASRTGLKQVPAALTHSIRSLRLADNDIRSVNCGDLDSYPLLQLLDLTSNQLVTIEEDALGRLDSLVVLYLAGNCISEIPRSLPEKLKALHADHNAVGRLAERDFQELTELEVLLLSDNNISVIEQGAFSRLESLITLDLSRNPVLVLQPGSLTGPFALQNLRLSSMRVIPPAEENTFPISTPDNLITLDLSDSPGLARQLLADTAILVASKQLQELDLSGTSLEYIRSDLLHFLPQLRALHIRRNRLNCTQLHWLASWLRRQDTLENRDVVCSSPPDLWGIPLIDLQSDEASTEDSSPMQRMVTVGTSTKMTQVVLTTPALLDNVHQSLPSTGRLRNQTASGTFKKIPVKKAVADDRHGNENESFKDGKQASTTTSRADGSSGAGDVAITETWILPEQTDELPAENANETASNSPSPSGGFISELSRNLLVARYEKTFNHSSEQSRSMPQWDGEMSMYTNSKRNGGFLHPGMLILAAGVAAAAAALAVLAARFVRNRRACSVDDDIEVAISLPTVADLW